MKNGWKKFGGGYSKQAAFFAAIFMLGSLAPCFGETKTWTGTESTDWHTDGNWDSPGVPADGDDVVIPESAVTNVLLSDVTAALSSFVIETNRTLTFTNWTTILNATNVTINGGATLTHIGPYTTTSNRVYIACVNLHVQSNGSINVDYKGFKAGAATTAAGYGPGGGKYSSSGSVLRKRGSAGHAGLGGNPSDNFGWQASIGGDMYGSLTEPQDPGSGGCGSTTVGSGGGAVRVDASGTVTIDGLITARGQAGTTANTYLGSGSGGSIWITCDTLGGENGEVRADSLSQATWPNAGSGGRIALTYTQVAPTHSVRVSAGSGKHVYPFYENEIEREGAQGTIYLANTNLLSSIMTLGTGGGRIYLPDDATACEIADLTLNDIAVGLGNVNLTVTGDITISGTSGMLYLYTNANVTCGGSLILTNGATLLSQRGNVTIASNVVMAGSGTQRAAFRGYACWHIGGDMLLTNDSTVYLQSGITNAATPDYGLLVSVTGDVTMAEGTWFYLTSHYRYGGDPLLRMRNLNIATNAGFNANYGTGLNANYGGFYGPYSGSGYGPGGGTLTGGGGGYGGKGGRTDAAGTAGLPYGSSLEPISAGSGGSKGTGANWPGRGGGAIRVEASQNVVLNGTMTANGGVGVAAPLPFSTATTSGCGAGGGIYVRCAAFQGGDDAALSANGGSAASGGAGGGGRIAVWYEVDEERRQKILAGDLQYVFMSTTHPDFTGSISATNGTGLYNPPDAKGADPGTIVFLTVHIPGTVFYMR